MGAKTNYHVLRGKEHWAFGLVLLVGLIHGLIYVYLIPPWQHYDEPGHFEFAWLIANREGLPRQGGYDQTLRRELAASMIEHDFFKSLSYRPNLLSIEEPVWIGVPQISRLPLYHQLVAVPLSLLRFSEITVQLYTARLVSLILFVITIGATWGVVAEIAPQNYKLQAIIPLTLALLPGFVDIMTSVNDDAGATAFFSLFLLASVVMIRRGFSWLRFLSVSVTALLCFFTKNTVTIALPLALVALLLSIRIRERRSLAGLILLAGMLVFVISCFAWGDASQWARLSQQPIPTRSSVHNAPLGSNGFRLVSSPGVSPPQIIQILPYSQVQHLRGQQVTLGAWIWSDQVTQANTPTIRDDTQAIFQTVTVGPEPSFYLISGRIAENTGRLRIELTPTLEDTTAEVVYYFDGLVLVAGDYSNKNPPQFQNTDGRNGTWDDKPFVNLIRNASAETGWPWIKPWFEQLIMAFFPTRPSLILTALLDWQSADWYYQSTARNMFFTFWGKFGWGHVPLVGYHPYRILMGATLAGILGFVIAIYRYRKSIPWNEVTFMAIVLPAIWAPVLMRGIASLAWEVFIPSSRYAFPAIIPVASALTIGWLEFLRPGEKWLRLRSPAKYVIMILFFFALDIIAILSILHYY